MSALLKTSPASTLTPPHLAWQDGSPRPADTSRRQRPRVTVVASRWGRISSLRCVRPHRSRGADSGWGATQPNGLVPSAVSALGSH